MRIGPLPLWAWLLPLLMLVLAALQWSTAPTADHRSTRLTQAEATLVDAARPQTRSVALPHVLDDEPPEWWSTVEYRIPWPQAQAYQRPDETRLALLMPRVATRVKVLLNGQPVYEFGWSEPADRTVLSAALPHFVPLPQTLLTPDWRDNDLVVRVQARVLERSGLWPVDVGDHDALQKRFRLLEFWQTTVTWMMWLVSLLVGLMSVFLWRALRERLFLLIAATALSHMMRSAFFVMTEVPISHEWLFVLNRLCLGAHGMFFVLTVEELFGRRYPVIRRLAYAGLVATPIMVGLTALTSNYDWTRWWAGGLVLISLVTLTWAVADQIRRRAFADEQALISLVALFTLITGIRDFLVIQLNFPGDGDIRWMTTGGIALMLALGWVLVDRATAWARTVHRLNDSLALTVAQREAELRTAFERLQAVDRQRAVEEERRRLMRDMHDGLGSQLVQTLNLVRTAGPELDRHAIASLLAQALDELRLTLDSFEPMEGDLPAILGTLRRRLGPALEGAGIELRWEVQDVPPLEVLDSRGVMHLFRCLQEIFANVVKHAHARRITVRTRHHDNQIVLSVEDDGVGVPSPDTAMAQGRGLRNILTRAAKIGATVRFYDAAPGTGIEFIFSADGSPPESDSDWMRRTP